MSAKDYHKLTAAEQAGEDFMSKNWRPMMAITYMMTCIFDFIAGPILYNVLQYYNPGQHLDMWQPLTLQGGGLYHIAMGVVLGITAHGRTQEKINGADAPAGPAMPGIGGMLSNLAPQPAPQQFAPQQFAPQPAAFQPPAPMVEPVQSGKLGRIVPQEEEPLL